MGRFSLREASGDPPLQLAKLDRPLVEGPPDDGSAGPCAFEFLHVSRVPNPSRRDYLHPGRKRELLDGRDVRTRSHPVSAHVGRQQIPETLSLHPPCTRDEGHPSLLFPPHY